MVDLDQLFGIFDAETREGLQRLIKGSAEQYDGVAPQLQESSRYFPPALAAFDHVLAQLGRDQNTFSSFLVESAKATTVLAAHGQQLTELVSHADAALGALGSQQSDLAAGVKELPVTLEEGNRTFEQLPATLADLTKLVNAPSRRAALARTVRNQAAPARDQPATPVPQATSAKRSQSPAQATI